MRLLKRLAKILEGLVFMMLGLCLQSIFVVFLTGALMAGLSAIGLRMGDTVWPSILFPTRHVPETSPTHGAEVPNGRGA